MTCSIYYTLHTIYNVKNTSCITNSILYNTCMYYIVFTMYNLSKYADISKVIADENYAKSKHLIVKKLNSPKTLFMIELTSKQKNNFFQTGFFILPNVFNLAEIDEMKDINKILIVIFNHIA